MRRLRIKGIVQAANHVRHMVSAPLSAEQRQALERDIATSLSRIDSLLRENRASPEDLPAPSRRAYQFLKQVRLEHVPLQAGRSEAAPALPETISFPGLRAFIDRILDDIALSLDADRFKPEATLRILVQTTDRLNHTMGQRGFEAAHLKPEARQLLGWLRMFTSAEWFGLYVEAVCRAQAAWGRLPFARAGWQPPFLVHFRPSGNMYRCRQTDEGLRVVLETPMVIFDDQTLRRIGRQMLGDRRHHAAILETMLTPEYKAVSDRLEAAVGVVEQTRGLVHDLADSFRRVNREYFDDALSRPRLTWNSQITRCVFGHYDFVHDTVWISRTLDRPEVPSFVVDHVMHHELLHKKHGFEWRGAQQHSHTPAFREEERAFRRYDEAARFLNRLSARRW